jgi:fermentation-respiration switch protein FrsA (DUF1100 family)
MSDLAPDATPGAPAPYAFADPRALLAATEGARAPVTFPSEGVTLAGHVYRPPVAAGRLPAVVLLGPMTYVKEQVPAEYARRLAARGYVALAFDPRFRGESGGEPRDLESPLAKVADVRSAVDYLAARPDVDPARIAAVAVCQGSSEMLRAAADEPRIGALATVAGHYRDREGDLAWLGGEAALAARRARGEAARAAYERSGEAEYVPGVDRERADVGMPGEYVWSWYHRWADAGVWPNRYAVMSDAELLAYESLSAAERLETPYLMLHSDNSFLPDAARRHFDRVPARAKRLSWAGATQHFQFYDDPAVIDGAVAEIDTWFAAHLPPTAAPEPPVA